MLLNRIPLDAPFVPGNASRVPPNRAMSHAAVHWLTCGEAASRAFAGLTASPWETATGECPAPDENPALWLTRGADALRRANPPLVRSLREARTHPVIVVRGLPVETVAPPTPYGGAIDAAASHRSIVNLHAVAACLGLHPVAYAGESASTLHPVCPERRAAGQRSSRGFDAALPFHTDYADRPLDAAAAGQSPAAAALIFAVERAAPETPMECVALDRLLAALSPAQLEAGQAEEFAVYAPDIFGGAPFPRLHRLLLPDGIGGFRGRLNLGKMIGITPRAVTLLRTIEDVLSDDAIVEKIHVRRGDIVVMDNQRAIHRRAVFAPRWDGADRYFIRMSAARDHLAGVAADSRRPWVWS